MQTGAIQATLTWISEHGIEALVLDDLHVADLPLIGWSGNAGHIRNIADRLERVAAKEIDYLVIRAPTGQPISKLCIDYMVRPGAGMLMQLATHPEYRRMDSRGG